MSAPDTTPQAAPFVSDYVPGTVGHVVLAVGCDHTGADAVAVWQVSPTGQPTGAWILTIGAEGAEAKAQRLLGVLRRRSVVGWDGATPATALERIADVAGAPPVAGWEDGAVFLPEILDDIAALRRQHADAVAEYQKSARSKVAPLAWQVDVPTGLASLDELAAAAGVAAPGTSCEVADRALQVARLVAWTAGLWQETEQVRLRRRYLVERFGPASALPARWLAKLRAANAAGTARRGDLAGVR